MWLCNLHHSRILSCSDRLKVRNLAVRYSECGVRQTPREMSHRILRTTYSAQCTLRFTRWQAFIIAFIRRVPTDPATTRMLKSTFPLVVEREVKKAPPVGVYVRIKEHNKP
ncbi:uncharacterized protein LAJ45_06039 [Morchella importuna]|uniref:uncharacterized protein n=1 Tax=Morchella importuna TaxID=1174673 RepID=UPI001E8DFCD7|nr:uncharacterized protein LAJ45_06039 [Morchella importuna]KAH8149887.1 hypothetical protein LAJ45_06039 [Morchella importuna]